MKSGFEFLSLNPPFGTDFSEVKSVFEFRVRLQNPKSGFQNLNPNSPIERNLKVPPKDISGHNRTWTTIAFCNDQDFSYMHRFHLRVHQLSKFHWVREDFYMKKEFNSYSIFFLYTNIATVSFDCTPITSPWRQHVETIYIVVNKFFFFVEVVKPKDGVKWTSRPFVYDNIWGFNRWDIITMYT